MGKKLFIFILLFGVIFFFTNGFLNTFFQQDEWNGFGLVIHLAHQSPLSWFGMLTSQHFIPFTGLFWLFLYRIFGFQPQFFALTSLLLHSIASYLVFELASRLSKNKWIGILTAILFATNVCASQAFMHLGVFANTIPCLILMLLFLLYLSSITAKKVFEKKDLIVLLSLFLSAVFFREDALILIPLFIAFNLIYNKKSFNRKNIVFFIIFFSVVLIFFLFRVSMQLLDPTGIQVSRKIFLLTYFYNLSTLPFKFVVENLFTGYPFLFQFTGRIIGVMYDISISPDVILSVVMDYMVLIIFSLLSIFFYFLTRGIKQKTFWNSFYFSLVIILSHALILSTVGRRIWIVESRYLYFSSIGVYFIFSFLLFTILKRNYGFRLANFMKVIIGVILLIFLLSNSYFQMQKNIRDTQFDAAAKKSIISDIKTLYPTIPKKTIFFVKCKGTCHNNGRFYLSDSLVLPFSSGPGWIIMLYYSRLNEKAYAPFFTRYEGETEIWDWKVHKFAKVKNLEFLWDMGAQGYREIGDYGFGYFTSVDFLKETLSKNKLNKDIVIGLEYNEKNFKINDISKEIRDSIK